MAKRTTLALALLLATNPALGQAPADDAPVQAEAKAEGTDETVGEPVAQPAAEPEEPRAQKPAPARATRTARAPVMDTETPPTDEPEDRDETPPSAHPEHWGKDRTMGGHRFPFPQFLASSFVVSSFAVHAGFELRRVPNYPVDISTGALTASQINLNTLSATQGIDASIRLLPALALTFDFYGQARLGTDTSSLLGTGADYLLGGDGGLLLRLFRSERFQVSVRGQGGYHGGQQAGVTQFYAALRSVATSEVSRVLAGGTTLAQEQARIDAAMAAASQTLTSQVSGFGASVVASAAVALSTWAGLQAMVGYAFDRTTTTTNVFQVDTISTARLSASRATSLALLGIALDVGGAASGIPLDLVAEYEVLPLSASKSGGVASRGTVEQRLALGVYYSGRPDLQLGVSGYTLFSQLGELGAEDRVSGKAYDAGGLFVFRYIW